MKRSLYDILEKLLNMSRNYGFFRGLLILTKLKLSKSGNIKLPDIKHPIKIRLSSSDKITFHQVFTYLHYDIDFGFEPSLIIDAGANVGLASIYFKNRYPKAKILTIEPEKSNFSLLSENLEKYEDIVCYENALSNEPGGVLEVIDNGSGNWGMVTLKEGANETGQVLGTVNTITINDLIDEHNLEVIDVLKVDIEGAEKELFSNNYERWLPITKILIVELHDRMKEGTSTSVFNAVNKYSFDFDYQGENLIFTNKNL